MEHPPKKKWQTLTFWQEQWNNWWMWLLAFFLFVFCFPVIMHWFFLSQPITYITLFLFFP